MKGKRIIWIVLALVAMLLLPGCYIADEIETDEIGVHLDAGKVDECLGPGVYTDMGWYQTLKTISRATLTFSVEDPEVVTSDNQRVGVKVTIQARRMTECEAVKNLMSNWNPLIKDQPLVDTVSATARESLKVGTRQFTLTQLLDDRNGLSGKIQDALTVDAERYSVEIVNVTIENVAIDPEYAKLLDEKALLTAQIDKAVRQQDLINQQASNDRLEQEQRQTILEQQVLAEKAQTAVEVEIAKRAGEVTAASQQVYSDNPQAYELKKMELMAKIFGDRAVIWMIPQGTDISLWLSQYGNNVVPAAPVTTP